MFVLLTGTCRSAESVSGGLTSEASPLQVRQWCLLRRRRQQQHHHTVCGVRSFAIGRGAEYCELKEREHEQRAEETEVVRRS